MTVSYVPEAFGLGRVIGEGYIGMGSIIFGTVNFGPACYFWSKKC